MPTPTPGASTSPSDSSSSGASSSPGASATPDKQGSTMGDNGVACQTPTIDQSHMPQQIAYVIPGSWYWQAVAFESGLLLVGSLFLGAIAFVWVDRRRPY
jgi:hypothetical protein